LSVSEGRRPGVADLVLVAVLDQDEVARTQWDRTFAAEPQTLPLHDRGFDDRRREINAPEPLALKRRPS